MEIGVRVSRNEKVKEYYVERMGGESHRRRKECRGKQGRSGAPLPDALEEPFYELDVEEDVKKGEENVAAG